MAGKKNPSDKRNFTYEFLKGLWDEHPLFRQVLGMCPTLAVTNTVENGIAMGLATTFVLVCSSTLVTLIRSVVPRQVRIATFVVIIATFVTVADLFMKAKFPPISKALGPFVPLIVVNCIILGRAEAFASKNPVFPSILDALGNSVGFIIGLLVLSSIRELLGSGTILGMRVLGEWFRPWVVMILPPGAFLTLGILVGLQNLASRRASRG